MSAVWQFLPELKRLIDWLTDYTIEQGRNQNLYGGVLSLPYLPFLPFRLPSLSIRREAAPRMQLEGLGAM